MLTKTELNEKKLKTSDKPISTEPINNEDKTRRKQRWLFIALFSTIGLSFAFWSYRQILILIKSPLPAFTLPTLPTVVVSNSFDDQITRLISSDTNRWSISVYLPDQNKNFDWSNNSQVFDYQNILKQASARKINTAIFTKPHLPEGLDIREIYFDTNYQQTLYVLVNIPSRRMLFMVSSNGPDIPAVKNMLPKIVSDLYWLTIKD